MTALRAQMVVRVFLRAQLDQGGARCLLVPGPEMFRKCASLPSDAGRCMGCRDGHGRHPNVTSLEVHLVGLQVVLKEATCWWYLASEPPCLSLEFQVTHCTFSAFACHPSIILPNHPAQVMGLEGTISQGSKGPEVCSVSPLFSGTSLLPKPRYRRDDGTLGRPVLMTCYAKLRTLARYMPQP